MMIIEVLLLVAGFNAATIGLDHWVIPWLRQRRAANGSRRDATNGPTGNHGSVRV